MKQEVEFEDECEVQDVPVSPLLSEERKNRYGSVPGLDDEELADPRELERQVMIAEWGPILALPVKSRKGWIQPTIDESGHLDWGAFGTVDFSRMVPEFDKARYKADKLEEHLGDLFIQLGVVSERLPMARCKVFEYLSKGLIELEHIENEDMRNIARLYLRTRRLQQEIRELRKLSYRRKQARLAEVLQ